MNVLDNHINKILAEAGLSHSERKIYRAGSSKGMSSAALLRKTRVPRPTLMAALKTLRDNGLCETYRRDGRSLYYVMLPIVALKPHLGKKLRHLDDLLEELDSIETVKQKQISVIEADGQEEVIDLFEQALRCKSKQWRVIAPKQNALQYLPKEYLSYFKRLRSEHKIRTKTLWEADIHNQQLALKDVFLQEPRFIPPAANAPSLVVAFDNCLMTIQGGAEPRGVLVRNRALTQAFELMFEMAWQSVSPKRVE